MAMCVMAVEVLPVPVLLAGGETYDVAGRISVRAAFTLDPAASRGDDQHLAEG